MTVLTGYERTGWVHPELAHFLYWTAAVNTDYATHYVKLHNYSPACAARNAFCRQFKDSEADWLLMIDNDMVPATNLLDTIKGAPEDAMVVTPRYHMWDGDLGSTRTCWGINSLPLETDGTALLQPGFHELDKCGSGTLFIRPQLLREVTPPWFFYSYDADGGMASTEDVEFCMRIRKLGYKIYGNAMITLGHYHNVNLFHVDKAIHDLKRFRIPAPEKTLDDVEKNVDNANQVSAQSVTKDVVSPTITPSVAAVSPTDSCTQEAIAS